MTGCTRAAPSWLSDAHQHITGGLRDSGSGPPAGRVNDRYVEAHPTASADGYVVRWLVDDTDRHLAETAGPAGVPPVPARWTDPAGLPDWVVPDGFAG